MGVRRFDSLVRGLPPSARLWAPENGGWSISDHRLADIAELIHANYRMVYASIPMKQRKKIPPLLIPRPGQKPEPKKSWIREWTQKARGR